jgi:hypothetical protein
MAFDFKSLLAQPVLTALTGGQSNIIVSARLWVAMRKRGGDPSPVMAQRLGSDSAAWQFWLLMEEVGTAWPDPFLVSPPCCGRMSHDEALLLDMLHHAAARDGAAFHNLLAEMLPMDHRERLYGTAGALVTALTQPITR